MQGLQNPHEERSEHLSMPRWTHNMRGLHCEHKGIINTIGQALDFQRQLNSHDSSSSNHKKLHVFLGVKDGIFV